MVKLSNHIDYVGFVLASIFLIVGLVLSFRRGRLHPLLLVCISAFSICWIEAPYDWSMYAQFPPGVPRMPSWWPLNWTWGGGVPSSILLGYVFYMALPAILSVVVARGLSRKRPWPTPVMLLTVGLVIGTLWAFIFNGLLGAQGNTFHYGRVIPGLALWPGTIHQYPLYDSLAMGVQMMVYSYLLGRRDALGRTFVAAWADSKTKTQLGSSVLTVVGIIVIGNAVYLSVFAPHLATKLLHLQTVAPNQEIYQGVPNQPL